MSLSRKKKVFIHSDFSLAKTGFGRAMKSLLTYLYKTDKYELVHYCCGLNYSNPNLSKTPWRSIGCLPDNQHEIDMLNKDPVTARDASYGGHLIDKIIAQEKPDIYIGSQDIWAFPNYQDKFWWNKIPCVIWTTLDSLPVLQTAIDAAPKINNYWIWSSFATKALHDIGHKHVKTVHGPLDDSFFYKLSNDNKNQLRNRFNIPLDTFIIGFVFRNQLRKSVPNLIEGFKIFKQNNPKLKSKLLLHTSYTEGWNINKLANEYKVPHEDIITTYVCKVCGNYEVKNFTGEDQDCKFCNCKKSVGTTNVAKGVTEEQLNEIYNLMDVYCHPFTSGGQEIPIQEAKLAELITLVTNYSCGEELCEEGSGSLPLDWAEYREHGTEFRKASTLPSSIAKQLNKVLNMDKDKRNQIGKLSRDWTLNNFSVNNIGKQIESFIDSVEITDYNFSNEVKPKNPNAIIPDIADDKEWVKALYKEILNMEVSDQDSGLIHWLENIKKGATKQSILDFFRNVAINENNKNQKPKDLSYFLNKNDSKRVLVILPESIGDIYIATSLFKSIRDRYPKPEWSFYFATKQEYFELLDANPYVDNVIPYTSDMDNLLSLEGAGPNKGYFDVVYPIHFPTQRLLSYLHNGIDKIDLDIEQKEVCI